MIAEELERVKKRIRWIFTESVRYLRSSPELEFVLDKTAMEHESTKRLLDSLEPQNKER
jgi:ribosome-binding factor A